MIEAINIMAYYECNSGTKDFELVLSINFALCRREGTTTTGTFYPSRTNTLDTTYTGTIDSQSTTFVVKTVYTIFKENISSSLS